MWNRSTACSCFPLFQGKCSCHVKNWVFFVCSLDILLQKTDIFFCFENQISKWRIFEKKGCFLTYFSHFLGSRGKLQEFLQHICHSHTYIYFAHPIDLFCLTNFEKKKNLRIYQVWCLTVSLV